MSPTSEEVGRFCVSAAPWGRRLQVICRYRHPARIDSIICSSVGGRASVREAPPASLRAACSNIPMTRSRSRTSSSVMRGWTHAGAWSVPETTESPTLRERGGVRHTPVAAMETCRVSTTFALLLIYIAAGICEIYGLYATVNTYLREDPDNDGLYILEQAQSRWERARGPVFIVLGVLVGLAGNIASLYLK